MRDPDKELEVSLRLTEEGWLVRAGDREEGPFKYLSNIDSIEVAKKLRVHPQAVFRAKLRVKASESPLPIEDRDTIELEDLTVQPSFGELAVKVHPAIGIVEDHAYVGVFLPCIVYSKNKKRKQEEEIKRRKAELLFLITDFRKKILANREVLEGLGWDLAYRPCQFKNRWTPISVQAYLNGESVDPAKVYNEVKKAWKEYIEFPDPSIYDLLTLWVIGTYFHHLFNAYPYVYIGGVKRAGKTKTLTLASLLAFNAIFSGNVSTSAVFRLIQGGRCTFLIDETEHLVNPERKQDFRNLLLSGYKKGGVVYRTEKKSKDRMVPEAFEIYSPKMLANIQGLEDVLEDRCITIIMKRGKNREIINREIDILDPYWQEIRDHLYLLYLCYWREILDEYLRISDVYDVNAVCDITENNIMNELSGRELELWKPILALASFFDKYIPIMSQTTETTQTTLKDEMLQLAYRKAKEKHVENMTETGEAILIETLLETVKEDGYYKVKEIRDKMAEKFEEEQKWLNTRWIGRALKRLGFTDKRRLGTGREYRFTKKAIIDLAERLGIETSQTSSKEASETSSDKVCEVCGSKGAKFHLVPGQGTKWICDRCLEDYGGDV